MHVAKNLWNWIKNASIFGVFCLVVGLFALILLDSSSSRVRSRQVDREMERAAESPVAVAVQALDACFERDWEQNGLQPAPRADDLLFARRLALSLAGTIPSLEEIRQLEKIPPDRRKIWWVDHLLEDKRTSDYLAERFARAWVGVEDGPFLVYRRRRFVTWLSDELRANRPYDELVRKLISATGLWTDQPQANFISRTINQDVEPNNPDPILLAGRTSRAFLGMRIDCLQCHDDFLGNVNLGTLEEPRGGTQRDFHALAAFYYQAENSLTGIRDNASASPYQKKLLGSDGPEDIAPVVPILPNLVDPSLSSPRQRLAAWLTHEENRAFSRATVNRVWAILFGKPLIQPVDDIPLEGPFPEAMEVLVDDFVQHHFDLQRLIRLIALSRPFGIESSAENPIASSHEQHWAVFPLTRLRPEQMAGAMLQATQIKTIDGTSHILTQLIRLGQEIDFVERFGDPGEDEFADRGETVTQRLLLFNGDMMSENLNNEWNIPVRLHQIAADNDKTLQTIFLTTFSRLPTEEEVQKFRPLSDIPKPASEQVLDLYWSMINSAEFRWNH